MHFNTPMSTNHPTGFPQDLEDAKALTGTRLSFCTIQTNDRGPWQINDFRDANAVGSVGLVVDVKDEDSVATVDWTDSGSSGSGSLGNPPTEQNCEESISKRVNSNEWWVQDYIPLGIFVFLPAMVFVKGPSGQGEIDVTPEQIFDAYPQDRIFSVLNGSFIELDRVAGKWNPVTYDQIVPA